MAHAQNDMTPAEAAAALVWLVEMGADEICLEAPVDRFATSTAPAKEAVPVTAKPELGQKRKAEAQVAPAAPAASLPAAPLAAEAFAVAQTCRTAEELVQAFSQLENASLRKSANRTCFLGGAKDAAVLVIGDKPGKDEDVSGEVFSTTTALLLSRMLAAIGLSPSDPDREKAVMLANLVPWRPPGGRAPSLLEVQQCQPFSQRLITLTKPRIILSLGALPAHRLAGGDEQVTRQRGKWLRHITAEGDAIPVMTTFHPEFLLRQPTHKRLAWRDLLAVREALDAH
jgi:DNA polymerase